jgi:hypothetical protein
VFFYESRPSLSITYLSLCGTFPKELCSEGFVEELLTRFLHRKAVLYMIFRSSLNICNFEIYYADCCPLLKIFVMISEGDMLNFCNLLASYFMLAYVESYFERYRFLSRQL